ncbi:MAG: GntR family transcriptional regulator [Pseudomonadota bacterium]
MDLHLSQSDGVPVYLQIINQIKHLISSDRLVAGQEIPPIRTLAQQLLVNPNTVARAYRELESAGWVYKRRGAGTFVAERRSPLSREERLRIVSERIRGLLTEARQLDVSVAELIALIEAEDSERQESNDNERIRSNG